MTKEQLVSIRVALLALIRAPERPSGYESSIRAEGYAEGYNDAILQITRAVTGERINAGSALVSDDWWKKL